MCGLPISEPKQTRTANGCTSKRLKLPMSFTGWEVLSMSILNQNLLTLDFWQDKVTYGKRTVPIGTIGCAALNITDEQIAELITL